MAGSIRTPFPYYGPSGSVWAGVRQAIDNYRINRRRQASGDQDCFLARFDKRGNQVWFREECTPDDDCASVIAVDSKGNVFIAGGERQAGKGSIWGRLFAAKYDADGCLMWRTRIGGYDDVVAHGIRVDNKGGIYVCGECSAPSPTHVQYFLVKLQERR